MLQQPPHYAPQTPKPWYAGPIFTVLMLVLFFPLGLALMWACRTEWSARAKWIVTGAFGAFTLACAFSPPPPPSKTPTSVATAPPAAPKPPAAPAPSKPAAQVAAEKEAAQKRQQAKQVAAAKHTRDEQIAARVKAAKGIGLTYDQVMNHLTDGFDLSTGTPVKGKRNVSGSSTNPIGAIVQVIGDPDNVWTASMTVILATAENDGGQATADAANNTNAARMLVFVQNVAPDWDGAMNWVTTTLGEAQSHPGKHYSVVRGDRKYMVEFEDMVNTSTIVVSRADDHED